MSDELTMERRSRMLADRLKDKKQIIVMAIRPPGQRPPFTQQLSRSDALAFWQKHRYDDIGKQVLDRMDPMDIMELDQALSQDNVAVQTQEVDDGF